MGAVTGRSVPTVFQPPACVWPTRLRHLARLHLRQRRIVVCTIICRHRVRCDMQSGDIPLPPAVAADPGADPLGSPLPSGAAERVPPIIPRPPVPSSITTASPDAAISTGGSFENNSEIRRFRSPAVAPAGRSHGCCIHQRQHGWRRPQHRRGPLPHGSGGPGHGRCGLGGPCHVAARRRSRRHYRQQSLGAGMM